jgi:hypothetical protein
MRGKEKTDLNIGLIFQQCFPFSDWLVTKNTEVKDAATRQIDKLFKVGV